MIRNPAGVVEGSHDGTATFIGASSGVAYDCVLATHVMESAVPIE